MISVRYVAAQSHQGAAIKTDGSLWRWGAIGQENNSLPVKVLENVKQVVLCDGYGCRALKEDGTLWSAGVNAGDGKDKTETLVKILDNVEEILTANYVRRTDGSIWAWGTGIGDGTNNKYLSPQKVRDNDVFAENTREGVNIVYSVVNEHDKTCQVGLGDNSAVNKTVPYVTIPSTANGYKVVGVGNSAFKRCESLATIFFPNTVKTIGNYAFSECESIKTITIPDGVTDIGEDAFYYCI